MKDSQGVYIGFSRCQGADCSFCMCEFVIWATRHGDKGFEGYRCGDRDGAMGRVRFRDGRLGKYRCGDREGAGEG